MLVVPSVRVQQCAAHDAFDALDPLARVLRRFHEKEVPSADGRILAGGGQYIGVVAAPGAQLKAVGEAEYRLVVPGHPTCGNDAENRCTGDHPGMVPQVFGGAVSDIRRRLPALWASSAKGA